MKCTVMRVLLPLIAFALLFHLQPLSAQEHQKSSDHPYVPSGYGGAVKLDEKTFSNNKVSLWRWRDDFQNDFAARMNWCTKSYDEANQPPVPMLNHPDTIAFKSGEGFALDASGTTDPDGDHLSFLWFHYPEAGSYKEWINMRSAENSHRVDVKAPEVEKKETADFILKVTDNGEPPLTRYERVIVTVLPK